jgi:hypothetical protein
LTIINRTLAARRRISPAIGYSAIVVGAYRNAAYIRPRFSQGPDHLQPAGRRTDSIPSLAQEMDDNGTHGLEFGAGNTKIDPAVLSGKLHALGELSRSSC